jgi:hypothetical protein
MLNITRYRTSKADALLPSASESNAYANSNLNFEFKLNPSLLICEPDLDSFLALPRLCFP